MRHIKNVVHIRAFVFMAVVCLLLSMRSGVSTSLPQFKTACVGEAFTKQSCLVTHICMRQMNGVLAVFLPGVAHDKDIVTISRLLNMTLTNLHIKVEHGLASWAVQDAHPEQAITVLRNQQNIHAYSFGHVLVNELFPLFLLLQNHFLKEIPRMLQILVHPTWKHDVIKHMTIQCMSKRSFIFSEYLAQQNSGICFPHLILGDGGYVRFSQYSLANWGQPEKDRYAQGPSFFSSQNWFAFRAFVLSNAGVLDVMQHSKPLIVLNDKRFGPQGSSDRRMILDIESVAANISAAFPEASVQTVRFRDLQWHVQLHMLARTKVFITTQGSSAFRLVFLPPGSTCIMIGSPEEPKTDWRSFHELDRWFPLSYVSFLRYVIDINNLNDYEVSPVPGHWQPGDAVANRQWWQYNANIRLSWERLFPMIAQALN